MSQEHEQKISSELPQQRESEPREAVVGKAVLLTMGDPARFDWNTWSHQGHVLSQLPFAYSYWIQHGNNSPLAPGKIDLISSKIKPGRSVPLETLRAATAKLNIVVPFDEEQDAAISRHPYVRREYAVRVGNVELVRDQFVIVRSVPNVVQPVSVNPDLRVQNVLMLNVAETQNLLSTGVVETNGEQHTLIDHLSPVPEHPVVTEPGSREEIAKLITDEQDTLKLDLSTRYCTRIAESPVLGKGQRTKLRKHLAQVALSAPQDQMNWMEVLHAAAITEMKKKGLSQEEIEVALRSAYEETFLKWNLEQIQFAGPQMPFMAARLLVKCQGLTPYMIDSLNEHCREVYGVIHSIYVTFGAQLNDPRAFQLIRDRLASIREFEKVYPEAFTGNEDPNDWRYKVLYRHEHSISAEETRQRARFAREDVQDVLMNELLFHLETFAAYDAYRTESNLPFFSYYNQYMEQLEWIKRAAQQYETVMTGLQSLMHVQVLREPDLIRDLDFSPMEAFLETNPAYAQLTPAERYAKMHKDFERRIIAKLQVFGRLNSNESFYTLLQKIRSYYLNDFGQMIAKATGKPQRFALYPDSRIISDYNLLHMVMAIMRVNPYSEEPIDPSHTWSAYRDFLGVLSWSSVRNTAGHLLETINESGTRNALYALLSSSDFPTARDPLFVDFDSGEFSFEGAVVPVHIFFGTKSLESLYAKIEQRAEWMIRRRAEGEESVEQLMPPDITDIYRGAAVFECETDEQKVAVFTEAMNKLIISQLIQSGGNVVINKIRCHPMYFSTLQELQELYKGAVTFELQQGGSSISNTKLPWVKFSLNGVEVQLFMSRDDYKAKKTDDASEYSLRRNIETVELNRLNLMALFLWDPQVRAALEAYFMYRGNGQDEASISAA